jgi:hypothetical protein
VLRAIAPQHSVEHRPLIEGVATGAPVLQSGIEVGETHFGQETEEAEIHAEDGCVDSRKDTRGRQQRAIAAENDDEAGTLLRQIRPVDDTVQHRIVAVLAQPRDQLRQNPRQLFPVRFADDRNAGHGSQCNGLGRKLSATIRLAG